MKFDGFIGPSYNLDAREVDCQRAVNIYPEVVESGKGKDGIVSFFRPTEGTKDFVTVGTGPIRCIWEGIPAPNPVYDFGVKKRFYVVSGNGLYTVFLNSMDEWQVSTSILTLGTSTGSCSGMSVEVQAPEIRRIILADGDDVYSQSSFAIDGLIVTFDSKASDDYDGDTSFSGPPVGTTQMLWLDGFIVSILRGTNQFYVSDWSSLDTDPLSFASAEGDLDKLICGATLNRNLYLFNEETFEIWSNTGNADFPFERISGGFIEVGILAERSLSKTDSTLFWLGRTKTGRGIVYATKGAQPERISTHAIEEAISKYSNPENATGYCYSRNGHDFYVLNFAEATWCYDLKTGQWHERAYTHPTTLELQRHRGDVALYYKEINDLILGDYENGKLYFMDPKKYDDADSFITRMRVFPHISASGNRLFCSELRIDMKTGVGLPGEVQGSDPQIMLDWSDDGGYSWSNEVWGSLGKSVGPIGDRKRRVKWNRLGSYRDRVFRVTVTDPVETVFLSADIEVKVGRS